MLSGGTAGKNQAKQPGRLSRELMQINSAVNAIFREVKKRKTVSGSEIEEIELAESSKFIKRGFN